MGSKSKIDVPIPRGRDHPGKLFVGGLAKGTTQAAFDEHFGRYGKIINSIIMKNWSTGEPEGYGFVTYADPAVADTVIKGRHVINGKKVDVNRPFRKGSKDFKTRRIFVGGIPSKVTEDELKRCFSKYGKVIEHNIVYDRKTNHSLRFGFVTFDREEVVDDLLSKGDKIDLAGTQVGIKKAEPQKASTAPPAPPTPPTPPAPPAPHAYGFNPMAMGVPYNGGFVPVPYWMPYGYGSGGVVYSGAYVAYGGYYPSWFGPYGGSNLGGYGHGGEGTSGYRGGNESSLGDGNGGSNLGGRGHGGEGTSGYGDGNEPGLGDGNGGNSLGGHGHGGEGTSGYVGGNEPGLGDGNGGSNVGGHGHGGEGTSGYGVGNEPSLGDGNGGSERRGGHRGSSRYHPYAR